MASQEILLITGANTGLGFETVKALCASGKPYEILLGGRSLEKAEAAAKSAKEQHPSSPSQMHPFQVDIESDESIQKAFQEVKSKFSRLDILLNNAGTQLDQQHAAGRMGMREMWNATWNVNTVGTQMMTTTFLPLLVQSPNPRLLFVTSGTSTLAGTEANMPFNQSPPRGWPKGDPLKSFGLAAYRSSKTGMNMMMREWYRILKEDGVKVWCVSPGHLATGLGIGSDANKAAGAGDPALGAKFICSVIEGARDADVGKIVLRNGVQPW